MIRATSKNANQVFNPKSTKPNAKEISKNNSARFISKNEVMTNPKPIPNFLREYLTLFLAISNSFLKL